MRLETSSIKDLANAHRMGHTCANLNGDLLFIWGGSDESVAYLPVKNNHLWIYDTLSGYWRHRLCTGDCPPYLSGATSSLIGQRMFVFGGHSTAQDNWLNSLYCLDLDTFCWQDLGAQARAEPTRPIRADKLVSWSHGGRFYVFGGYGWSQTEHLLELLDRQKDLQLAPDHRWPKFGWNNQLVEFNPRDNTWRWPSYSGKCPSARAAHSGALMGSTYYLFGGRDSRERLNDLYTLDMNTLAWTQIATFTSSILALDRPSIRHLLEEDLDQQAVAQDIPAAAEAVERQPQMLALANREEEEEEEEEEAPSPSSSRGQPSDDHRRQQQQQQQQEDEEDSVGSDDSDDEPDYPFDFNHPNHLLERWSLSSSSHPSTSFAPLATEDEPADDQCTASLSLDQLQARLQNCDSSSTCPTHEQQMHPSTSAAADNSTNSNSNGNSSSNSNSQDDQEQPADAANHHRREPDSELDTEPAPPAPTAQLTSETPKPAGRSFASFTPISEQQILLYGGINSLDENLNDCWVFDVNTKQWQPIDLKNKSARLWHTGARTKNNEVVIIGGSCSDKIDEICTDILTISLTPKSLKRLALDAAARSIRMRTVNRARGLPSTISKLIRLRKQAMRK